MAARIPEARGAAPRGAARSSRSSAVPRHASRVANSGAQRRPRGDQVAKAKRGGPRRGGLSGAQRPTARARPSRPGRATALAARDCVTGGGAEPAGPRSRLPTQIQNLDVQEWIIAEIHRKRLLKVKTNEISGTFLYGWNASTKFDKFERVEPA